MTSQPSARWFWFHLIWCNWIVAVVISRVCLHVLSYSYLCATIVGAVQNKPVLKITYFLQSSIKLWNNTLILIRERIFFLVGSKLIMFYGCTKLFGFCINFTTIHIMHFVPIYLYVRIYLNPSILGRECPSQRKTSPHATGDFTQQFNCHMENA